MSSFSGSIPGSLRGLADRASGPITDTLDALSAREPSWLVATRAQLEASGDAAEIYDADWRLLWVSPELRHFLGPATDEELGIGEHILDVHRRPLWAERVSAESRLEAARRSVPYILADSDETPEALAGRLGPELAEIVLACEPQAPPPVWSFELEFRHGELPPTQISCMNVRLHDPSGRFQGTARIYGPGMKASVLNVVARGDEQLFERMSRLISPGRRSVAILFADLESSVSLSRRLPSSVYFYLISSLTQAMDEAIMSHSGVVGKHAGDGVSAFFLADERDHAHASAAARAAVHAAFDIRKAAAEVSRRIGQESGIGDLEARVNISLHWGASVFMGQIATGGRLEVTALGDEVNEAARLEQAARGGEILASKPLLEQMSQGDAEALGLDTGAITYELISEREGVSRKAVRDVGNLPVTAL